MVPAKINDFVGGNEAPSQRMFFEISDVFASLNNDARDLKLYTKVWIIELYLCVKFRVRESSQSGVMTWKKTIPPNRAQLLRITSKRCYSTWMINSMSVFINIKFKFESRLRAEINPGKITFPWPTWGIVSRLQMKISKRKSTWGSTTMC